MEKRSLKTIRFVAAERSAEELAQVEPEVSFAAPGADGPDVAALAREYLANVLELEAGPVSFGPDAAREKFEMIWIKPCSTIAVATGT